MLHSYYEALVIKNQPIPYNYCKMLQCGNCMRQRFIKFVVIILFILMLLFPEQVFSGASDGLLLWFHSVLPTLLPFLILSNLLIWTHAVDWIVRITGPVLRHIFRISNYGSFVVVTGFLCGYPMGSKAATDLLREGHIELSEARYLLSFCNNASPIFIISYVVLQNLSRRRFILPALVILTMSPVLASFFFRLFLKNSLDTAVCRRLDDRRGEIKTKTAQNPLSSGSLIDSCIMNGFEMITRVGGYIMLFSIFVSLAQIPEIHNFFFQYLFLPSLELTSGISLLCGSTLSEPVVFFLCMVCTSFGGWCAAAQTRCMIAGTGLSVRPYIIQKLVTALVTSLLCCLYLYFIY